MICLSSRTLLISSWGLALVLLVQGSVALNDEQFIKNQISAYVSDVITKPGIWESMFNGEVAALYQAVVSQLENGEDLQEIKDMSERNYIIVRLAEKVLKTRQFGDILESYALASGSSEQQAVASIKSACGKIDAQFGPVHQEILRLQALSRDHSLINTFAGYNDLLMKLIVAHSACIRMNMQ